MQCRLCQNKNLKYKFKANNHTLYQCANCRFVQVTEKPSPQELEAIYSEIYFSNNKYRDTATQEKENKRRLAFTRRFLDRKGLKVMDFGCATGDFINFASHSYEMWGHDFSQYAVEKARQNNPGARERFHSGLLERNEYPPDFFDAVVLWDVIEHLWHPVFVCLQLLNYLKPGGYFFLSTPDIGSFTAKVTGKYWAFMTPPEHLGFFSKQSIAFLLEKKMNCKILVHKSIGKWANIGFIFYKIKRIFPRLIPGFLPRFFQMKYTRGLALYVPGSDIQYIVARKPLNDEIET